MEYTPDDFYALPPALRRKSHGDHLGITSPSEEESSSLPKPGTVSQHGFGFFQRAASSETYSKQDDSLLCSSSCLLGHQISASDVAAISAVRHARASPQLATERVAILANPAELRVRVPQRPRTPEFQGDALDFCGPLRLWVSSLDELRTIALILNHAVPWITLGNRLFDRCGHFPAQFPLCALFSNLERFRLDQLRLAAAVHNDDRNYRPHLLEGLALSAVSKPPGTRAPATPTRDPPHHTPSSTPNPGRPRLKIDSRRLQRTRKPKSVQAAYLTAQADSQWFRSLPPKVQQQHFSREEQARLANWRASIIFDAADRALYKLNHEARRSLDSSFSFASAPDTSSMAFSGRTADSAIDMDDSFYDSFRWLDEDDDIDLSLDDYHTHLAEANKSSTPASPTASQSLQRRKPSFRRTLSFTSTPLGRSSFSSKLPSTSQSSNVPSAFSNSTTSTRHRSFSRPKSSTPVLRHLSQSSVTSIDHPAQYYQDPEARLKLRVYLASPQKFDEAIEFGFPSLDNKENFYPPPRTSTEPRTTHESARTFLEDDSITGPPETRDGDKRQTIIEPPMDSPTLPSRYSYQQDQPKSSMNASRTTSPNPTRTPPRRKFSVEKSRPLQPIPLGYVQNAAGSREMTLKMTLTRADLRTADSAGHTPPNPVDPDDPLRLAELPVVDENRSIWDTPVEDTNMVKKMWRKIRKRRG
ncbi:hypothetical protein FQN55_004319 [Onygenales sp. PD_40]|nr:hypothetical protein FQN55_004319 [Onygenales sp. PD_40]